MSALSGLGGGPASNYNIAGNIPFTPSGGGFGAALGGGIGDAYTSAYNNALQQNSTQYSNILAGYQQTVQNQFAGQQPIQQGFNQLGNSVLGNLGLTMNNTGTGQAQAEAGVQSGYGQLAGNVAQTIQGVDQSQRQAIADTYAQQTGALSQSLINSGLGNTTVEGAMNRGLTLDEQKANIALSNQTAQLQAGYQSQLGLAGLNYAGQAIQANTAQSNLGAEQQASYGSQLGLAGLNFANQANQQNVGQANNQLGFMNSVQMQYPNAQSYQQLLANQGALQQQQSFMDMYGRQLAYGNANRGGVGAPPIAGAGPGQGTIPWAAGLGGNGSVGGIASNYLSANMQPAPAGTQPWNGQPQGMTDAQVQQAIDASGLGVYQPPQGSAMGAAMGPYYQNAGAASETYFGD